MYKLIFITCFFSIAYCSKTGYYWREYVEEIPKDAVVGGTNTDGKNVYIGQAYVKCAGILVIQIDPDVLEVVFATLNGTKVLGHKPKILCGRMENFYWIETNSTNYHQSVIDKHPVIGGQEDEYGGDLTIGRVLEDGHVYIGKINSILEEPEFFYRNNDNETVLESFEVLMYKPDKYIEKLA